MIALRLRRLWFALLPLAWLSEGVGGIALADGPSDPVAQTADASVGDEYAIPPGDPWYQPPPQQRGPRPTAGDRLVFKMRIAPHWFDGDDRFWYRNDLAGGAKEFILVDAVHGTRRPAFDHARLAAALSKAAGQTYKADRLPFDEIEFVDGAKVLPLPRRRCDLEVPPGFVRMLEGQGRSGGFHFRSRRRGIHTAKEPEPSAARRRGSSRTLRGAPFPRRQVDGIRQGAQRRRPGRGEDRGHPPEHRRQAGPVVRAALVVARLKDPGRVPDRTGRTQGGLPRCSHRPPAAAVPG